MWAAGAVYVDGPLGMDDGNIWLAAPWLAVAVACLALIRTAWKKYLVWLVWFLVVLVPWSAKSPSNERPWKPEWAKTAWVEFADGALKFHNFRNFDYRADGSVVESWETRTVGIRNLRGMDYFHDAFGGDLIDRAAQLLSAIAFERAEKVAREAFRMQAGQDGPGRLGFADDDREMLGPAVQRAERSDPRGFGAFERYPRRGHALQPVRCADIVGHDF